MNSESQTFSGNNYIKLESNLKRRSDNLIIYGDRSESEFALDILIEAFDEDTTGWYGNGVIYDLYTPNNIDRALFVLIFIDILRDLEDNKLIYDLVKYYHEKEIFRFISYKDLDVDHITQALKHAEETIWYPRKTNKYQEKVKDRRAQLCNMRQTVSNSINPSSKDDVLQGVQKGALGEIQTIEAAYDERTQTTTPKTEPREHEQSDVQDVDGAFQRNHVDRKPDVKVRFGEKPELTTWPYGGRTPCSLCLRSCDCLRSASREGERGSSSNAKVSNSTGQQLRGKFNKRL
nr:hypothetical protein [Hepelivirales sp.]